MGLAARDLAGKLDRIDHITVTPDLLATLMGAIRTNTAPVIEAH